MQEPATRYPFRCWMTPTPWNHVPQGPHFAEIEAAIARSREFGVSALMLTEVKLHQLIQYQRFAALNVPSVDPAWRTLAIANTQRFGRLCRENGIEPYVFCFELHEAPRIAQVYPEASDPNNSLLWEVTAERVHQTFELFPDLAGIEMYLDEGPTFNVSHLGQYRMPAPEIVARLIYTYLRAARTHHKNVIVSTFTNETYRLRDIQAGLKLVPPAPDLFVNNWVVPGDWGEYLAHQPLIGDVGGHQEIITFDFGGENLGQCQVPFCYPDYIKERWSDALRRSPNVVGYNGWAMWSWHYDTPQARPFILDTPNEINAYAMTLLVQDPATDTETIWDRWVGRCTSDPQAAQQVKGALQRTREIGEKAWMAKGFWFMEWPKSFLPGIRFLLHSPYNESTAEWDESLRPIEDAIFFPTAAFVESLVKDRTEALVSAEEGLEAIRQVRETLIPPWDKVLPASFERLVAFCRVSRPFTELFFRWKLWWLRRPGGDEGEIERCKAELLSLADAIEDQFGETSWPANGGRIRSFVGEIEQMMAYGHGPEIEWSGIFVSPLAKRYIHRILDLLSPGAEGAWWMGGLRTGDDVMAEVQRLQDQLLGLRTLESPQAALARPELA